jgi:hypothetical protein
VSKSHWKVRPTVVRRLVTEAQSLGLTVRGIEVSGDITRVLVAEQSEAAQQQQVDAAIRSKRVA